MDLMEDVLQDDFDGFDEWESNPRLDVGCVRISHDELEAYLYLPMPLFGEDPYTMGDVLSVLQRAGISYGLVKDNIQDMVEHKRYGQEILAAKGKSPVDGSDGFYQFEFNTEFSNKPKVRADGSVDYWSVHAIEVVEEGQVIAIYTPPVDGTNGVTVTGKFLMAKKGRPQPPLTGRGFDRSEDGLTFTANTGGKIEKKDYRIQITPVYEVNGDVDLHTGNIDFRGDVIIHGSVTAGASVRATGSITIDGTAEACQIDAGKDVLLRGGMLGNNKGIIHSKGNVTARFIEYAVVETEGNLEASSALCCNITSYETVKISGKQAHIIGGRVYGVCGVEAVCVGNDMEVATEVQVGTSKALMESFVSAEKALTSNVEMLGKIKEGIEAVERVALEKSIDISKDERRLALVRAQIMKQAEVARCKEERDRIKQLIDKSKGSTLKVLDTIYGGVRVFVNMSSAKLKEEQKCVEFTERSNNVVMHSMQITLAN